jgi:hypothetical protein
LEIIQVDGRLALEELARLRSEWRATGLYPVILGGGDHAAAPDWEDDEELDPVRTIADSRAIDAPAWFEEQVRRAEPDEFLEFEGQWPEGPVEPAELTAHTDILRKKPLPEVSIALLRLDAPWEAFAHLGWGAWNECPEPEVHCALHRYWGEQWGAQVVSITHDVVECAVSRPPQTREDALRLAREQYIYCRDIVEQGTETVPALAASLLGAPFWFFWWD